MTETILNKIRKLLELSKSNNEHEAALAAARAAELMVQHQIEEADLEVSTGETKADPIINEALDQCGRWVSWKGWIATGIAKAFGCETYRTNVWLNGKSGEEHRIIGPESAMSTVRYMYQYLTNEVARLADEGYSIECEERHKSGVITLPSARAWKASFRAGASSAIYDRLIAQRKQTIDNAAKEHSQALVVIDKQHDAIIEHHRKASPWNYTKTGKRRSTSGGYYPSSNDGWSAGDTAGKNVSLGGGRQISSGNKRLN
jgi:hypothetical protein